MDGKWVIWESETKLGVPAQELVCTGLGEDRPAGISLQATATLPLAVFQDDPHSCAPVLALLHHPQDPSGRRPTLQLTSTTPGSQHRRERWYYEACGQIPCSWAECQPAFRCGGMFLSYRQRLLLLN